MRSLATVISSIIFACIFIGTANAKDVHVSPVHSSTVSKMCGGRMQTGGGHSGCTTCGKRRCYDWDCNNNTGKCQMITIIKGTPPARRGTAGIKVPTRPVSGSRHLHPKGRTGMRPVRVGGAASPSHGSRHPPQMQRNFGTKRH